MRSGKLLPSLYFVIILACGFMSACNSTPTKLSPDYKIVYAADNGFSRDIFVMKSDGSGQMNLTEAVGYHGFGNPAWSPDGTKISYIGHVGFTLNSGPEDNIYVMDADGSNVIRLTNHLGWYADLVWSPDNRQVAFVSNLENNTDQIYVMNVDGSNLQQLTKSEDTWSLGSSSPDWSPDGTKIVFNHEYQIAIMNSDGSGLRHLTNDLGSCDDPLWSPDGSQIVFTSYVQDSELNGASQIFVVNADGSNLTQLTEENSEYFSPVWSPDGTRIAFKVNQDGNAIAYLGVMNANGTNKIQLASNASFTDRPVWSPDGRIIFYATPVNDTNMDIYIINVDGTSQINLTQKDFFDGDPDWR